MPVTIWLLMVSRSLWFPDLLVPSLVLHLMLCHMVSCRAGVECDVSCRSVAAGLISLARTVG